MSNACNSSRCSTSIVPREDKLCWICEFWVTNVNYSRLHALLAKLNAPFNSIKRRICSPYQKSRLTSIVWKKVLAYFWRPESRRQRDQKVALPEQTYSTNETIAHQTTCRHFVWCELPRDVHTPASCEYTWNFKTTCCKSLANMFGPLKGNENKLPLVANVLPPVERLSRACHYMLKHSSGRLSSETAPLMKHRAFGAKAQQPLTRTRMVRGGTGFHSSRQLA